VSAPRRLLFPVPYTALVNAFARSHGVTDWTDLGAGTGTATLPATRDLPLRRRRAVVAEPPAPLLTQAGWSVEPGDLRSWRGEGGAVSLFDVIEHLERPEAEAILTRLERDFGVVMVFTPRGFMPLDAATDPALAGRPFMWHRAGFSETDFAARGYMTFYWPIYHVTRQRRAYGAVLAFHGGGLTPAAVLGAYRRLAVTTLAGARAAWHWLATPRG
jgi:hypothetical protein